MAFLGVDPGVTAGGYGMVTAEGKFIACGPASDLANEHSLRLVWLACVEGQANRGSDAPGQMHGIAKLLVDYGRIQGILEAHQIRCEIIYPMTWRSHYKLVKAPWRELIAKVQQMWPDAPVSLKKHDGMAVGLLLADYASILNGRGKI